MDQKRLQMEAAGDIESHRAARRRFIDAMRQSPIAIHIDKPKEQHYELPSEFFQQVLGHRMKYSSCYWPDGITNLNAAEDAMLALTCERGEVADRMKILELGCGWGALSLWLAEKYPRSLIHAVSNSAPQRRFIEAVGRERGIQNLMVTIADMNEFDPQERYDRVVSIEMFEHMRNWDCLLSRIAAWLENLDRHRNDVMLILGEIYGTDRIKLWFDRWRIFFMACAELWGFHSGQGWLVLHYRLRKRI